MLTRVPAGGDFATDLLPALLLAGVAGGMAAPAAQIGALSGVTRSMTGLASGLVETMREIGGAVGVAAVSTVLVSRAGVNAFHAAFWVIFVVAALGAREVTREALTLTVNRMPGALVGFVALKGPANPSSTVGRDHCAVLAGRGPGRRGRPAAARGSSPARPASSVAAADAFAAAFDPPSPAPRTQAAG